MKSKKAMIAIEDEAIKTLPAEDQRAAEGVDRPAVVSKKVIPMLQGKVKEDYLALKKERTDLEKKPSPPGQVLTLSVNNCDLGRPCNTFARPRLLRTPRAKEVKPGLPGDTWASRANDYREGWSQNERPPNDPGRLDLTKDLTPFTARRCSSIACGYGLLRPRHCAESE